MLAITAQAVPDGATIAGEPSEIRSSGATTRAAEPFPSATPEARLRVTGDIFPAVVRLDVKQVSYAGGKRELHGGIGSGVIFDAEGRILTNYHVAGRAAEIYVTLNNKERVPGHLIGDDHWTDLAVVQLDMEYIKRKNIAFKFARFGDSSSLVPGQDVMAIGTPFGLARTVTLGIVSNTDRTLDDGGSGGSTRNIDGYETGDFNNWIQIDAAINPGNSGGPLVDLSANIVGINTRGGGQNLNFAVPIDIAKEVVASILKSTTPERKGRVDRSDLGVELKPLQGFEEFFNLTDKDLTRGVLVRAVDRFSPAHEAGVQTQDILLAVNDQETNARFPEEIAGVRKHIADLPVGTAVTLTVKRDGEIVKLQTKTARLESAIGEEREMKRWGLSVRSITRAYANDNKLDDAAGVLITSLSNGYPAARAELQAGDIIRRINRQPVTDLESFATAYEASIKNKDQTVLVEIKHGRSVQQLVMKVSADEGK